MTFLNTLAVAALVVTVWVVAGQVITVQFVAAWDVSALVTISEDDFIVVCEVGVISWPECYNAPTRKSLLWTNLS